MATTLKLRTDIKKLKGALSSKSLPAPIKAKLKAQLDKAQNELKAMQSGAKPRKVSTTKGTQTALTSLQKLVNKKKFSVYQGKGIDLKKDADQGALAVGRRVSKGIKGNQFGDAKSSKGNVYYEYRANRLDVKQPKKAQKYPKLEDGGMMAKGGEIKKEYLFNFVDGGWNSIVAKNKYEAIKLAKAKYNDDKSKIDESSFRIKTEKDYKQLLSSFYAKGGSTQGYDDKEDERLGMEYGKMSSKDLNSTHARRDDARFEERMAKGGEVNVDDIKSKMYGLFKGYLGNFISEEELINGLSRVLGKKRWFRYFRNDTGVNDVNSVKIHLSQRVNKDFEKEQMQIAIDEKGLRVYDFKGNEMMAKGGKTKEEPMVVRGYFEDEAYEYKDGGYVAVSETNDGYWYIMSKPSTKEHAELLIKMGVPRGEVGKVVTIDEAKKHGKVIGKEYLDRWVMAQGGVTEKEVVESNAEMVLSKIKEVHHHADELGNIVSKKSDIEAWVVAKIERASTDLSDITHYLDGQHEKMSMGGSINNYVHKMDKK